MAQTTTEINACDVSIWLDNAAGTLKDISGSSNQVSITLTLTSGATRTFASKWPRRKVCPKDAKIALSIVYSTTTDEGFDILKNWFFASDPGARTLKIYLPDKNVGSDTFSGEFVIDGDISIPLQAGTADPIVVSCTLAVSGEFSHSVAAT